MFYLNWAKLIIIFNEFRLNMPVILVNSGIVLFKPKALVRDPDEPFGL